MHNKEIVMQYVIHAACYVRLMCVQVSVSGSFLCMDEHVFRNINQGPSRPSVKYFVLLIQRHVKRKVGLANYNEFSGIY